MLVQLKRLYANANSTNIEESSRYGRYGLDFYFYLFGLETN